ncbi:MAG: M13 family peptidase [Bacilli bacterium]|nr:M13 family peptidase [Bacilli bacterium]
MDKKVRIQDDLFHYVNQEKIDQLVIPDDLPVAGGFAELRVNVEKVLMDDFKDLEKSRKFPDANVEKAINLYSIAKNVKKRNKQGIKPIAKDLKAIQSISDINLFNRKLKNFVLNSYPLPFNTFVDTDFKDSSKHCLMVMGPNTILPDTTMYAPENPNKDALLNMWKTFALQAINFTDLSDEDKALYINDTLEFDAIIATLVKSRQEYSEYTKMYNPFKVNKVNRLLAPVKFKRCLKQLFGYIPEIIIVADPRFVNNFKTLFNEENFPKYIHWAYVNFLLGSGRYLSEDLRNISGAFARALSGIAKPAEPVKYAYQLASGWFDQPVGLYYGRKYFGEEAKKDVVEMVEEIIAAYKERVANSEILCDQTKQKAILKLNTMKIKMGYPDKVDDIYDKYIVNKNDSLFKAVSNLRKIELLERLAELDKPVDRSKWLMPGHMVNACYDPSKNDITFPAAILQAPFYSIKQTRSENLGGIGAVIGHEISHAFDNNGAKMDENGNINNWWTKEDFKKFDKKTKEMIKQFDGIVLPWGKVNSALIVSENIADNGGMAVTLHIMKKMKDVNYEEYFLNWARIWCQKAKPEYQALLLTVDVHGPVLLRTNMPPRNFQEWYDTFDVKKTDKMYIAPNKRVVIW